ncbi:MAG: hydrogenase expression/formation protein HypE [Lentisphaerae bacterium]|nr:hydrogenase expression/formation protein HypE [Lentisphaerota bacterium]
MSADSVSSCPVPHVPKDTVLLGHGGGGRLMQQLLEGLILPAFRNPALDRRHDGAVVEFGGERVAFTTDSYVVHPLFFPGGDIGRLAVHGTLNDLAMCGAKPRYLSAGLIIEEGLPMADLGRIVESMRQAAAAAGVSLVTGDTKVVDRGKGDGLFINTAGLGVVPPGVDVGPDRLRAGDVIILNGDIGRHGMAIMAQREGLAFESTIVSDTADLSGLVAATVAAGVDMHCLRDCTRGGLGASLIELAETAGLHIRLREAAVPVVEPVRGACEILGLDPLYVANEGRCVLMVPPHEVAPALAAWRAHPEGRGACVIGEVGDPRRGGGGVTVESQIGTERLLDLFSGEQLPRIC